MRNMLLGGVLALLGSGAASAGSSWKPLFDGKSLNGWEVVGDGAWGVMDGGILVGDRTPGKAEHQSWLYTNKEYRQFDLELEYWTRIGGNSGVSLRDHTRAKFAGANHDGEKTPSHNGYEIQIYNSNAKAKYPTGSIYLFQEATNIHQKLTDWNKLRIESRDGLIRVLLNGTLVCEHPGDPARPKDGPIGLQLHDKASVVMFRNIRIREVSHR